MIRIKPVYIFLILILLVSLFGRLYRFDRILGDWHSWRQVDTASVTRNYIQNGIDLLRPTYHDLSNIPSGQDNLEGWRMVEFPFINALIAFTFKLTNGFGYPVHLFSRIWSIGFSLASIVVLFELVRRLSSQRVALISALVFGVLPFNLYYHTTVLPEIPLVFFSLTATLFWVRYSQKENNSDLVVFSLAAMLAMLLKPIFVFYVPALLYILIRNQGWGSLFRPKHFASAFVILAPFGLWRNWISQYPEGIPASSWLFNGNNIRFKGAFFRWIFADRFGRLILGYWGLIPFGLGLILRPNQKSGWFFHWLFLGMVLYLTIFATGNVTHDYYQIFIVPTLAIFTGLGLDYLWTGVARLKIHQERHTHTSAIIHEDHLDKADSYVEDDLTITQGAFNPLMSKVLAITCFLFMLAFGWFAIRDNFNINNPALISVYNQADSILPPDALVIAPYMGDTALLYQTHRSGWPIGFEIDEKIQMGATHYLSTAMDDETRELVDKCQVIHQEDLFTVIDLRECNE